MELFSEIYGCYYNVVAKVLEKAAADGGLNRVELDRIVRRHAFSESGLHLIPRLISGEWALLRGEDGRFFSRLAHRDTALPLTLLQKAWLRALLDDARIGLFLDEEALAELRQSLRTVEPLYRQGDFHIFDRAADGDDYGDAQYVAHFRLALCALREKQTLAVQYERPRDGLATLVVVPRRMLYSAKDDKFRLEADELVGTGARAVTLNIARVRALAPADYAGPASSHKAQKKRPAVTIAISGERNALERCMLQFASYDKQTAWDEAQGRHICEISYNAEEETELLIRLLSFGPVIEVLGPERFVKQVRRRIQQQLERME